MGQPIEKSASYCPFAQGNPVATTRREPNQQPAYSLPSPGYPSHPSKTEPPASYQFVLRSDISRYNEKCGLHFAVAPNVRSLNLPFVDKLEDDGAAFALTENEPRLAVSGPGWSGQTDFVKEKRTHDTFHLACLLIRSAFRAFPGLYVLSLDDGVGRGNAAHD